MNKNNSKKKQYHLARKEFNDLARKVRGKIEEFENIPEITVYQDKPNTFVLLILVLNVIGIGYVQVEGFGFAKVMRPDEWSPDCGVMIAYDRALFKLCKDVIKQLNLSDQNIDSWLPNIYPHQGPNIVYKETYQKTDITTTSKELPISAA